MSFSIGALASGNYNPSGSQDYSFLQDGWDGQFTQLEQAKMMSAINNPKYIPKPRKPTNQTRGRMNRWNIAMRQADKIDYNHYKNDPWFSKVAEWSGIQDFDSVNDMRGMLKSMQNAGIKGSSGAGRRTDEEFNAAVAAAMKAQKAEAASLEPSVVKGAEGYQTGMEGWIASLMGMIGGGSGANRFAGYNDDSHGGNYGIPSSYVQQPSQGWSPRGGW